MSSSRKLSPHTGITLSRYSGRGQGERSEPVVPTAPYRPSHASLVAKWFHLPLRTRRASIAVPGLPVPVPGQIILLTGPSGSGKSSLLRHFRRILPMPTLNLDRIPLPHRPIVDCFPHLSLTQTLHLLSRVGLAEAHSYLLPPRRLSAGQRWRLRLALALSQCRKGHELVGQAFLPATAGGVADVLIRPTPAVSVQSPSYCETNPTNPVFDRANAVFPLLAPKANPSQPQSNPICLLADEFAALLDRVTAAVIAHVLRREIFRSPNLCAILATSHDDLLPTLRPDLIIRCDFGQFTICHNERSPQ